MVIRLRGDLSLGDKAKMRLRTTREQFRQQCLEGAAFLEVGKRPLSVICEMPDFSVLRLSAMPFSVPSQKHPSLAVLLTPWVSVEGETSSFDFMD